jgi:hypothetical protein
MATTHDVIEFDRHDTSAVVAVMQELEAIGGSVGWINIGPALTDEEAAGIPTRSGLAAWFSGRGPAMPMGTWMPASLDGRPRAAQIGVEHGTGPNALDRLEEAGLVLPHDWTRRQDHAKHGVVADLPADADLASAVDWLIAAVTVLSTVVALGDSWTAVVYRS